jgi:glycerol-3-phosphate acyltransferase PlsY
MHWTFWLALCAAYAIGCVATGYYLVRIGAGQDIRLAGSGGTGARNVSRVLGRRAAAMTIMGDAGKGALAVVLANWITADASAPP